MQIKDCFLNLIFCEGGFERTVGSKEYQDGTPDDNANIPRLDISDNVEKVTFVQTSMHAMSLNFFIISTTTATDHPTHPNIRS